MGLSDLSAWILFGAATLAGLIVLAIILKVMTSRAGGARNLSHGGSLTPSEDGNRHHSKHGNEHHQHHGHGHHSHTDGGHYGGGHSH